jgi:hypothetical protein
LILAASWLQVPFDNNSSKLRLKMKIINTHHAEFLSLNFYLIINDKEPEEPLVIPKQNKVQLIRQIIIITLYVKG